MKTSKIVVWSALLAVYLAAELAPSSLRAQQARDTVEVTIQGTLATVKIDTIPRILHVGDSVQFTAHAVDSDGAPVTAVLAWASSDSTVLRIGSSSGLAVVLKKPAPGVVVYVWVLATQVDSLALTWYNTSAGPSSATVVTSSSPIPMTVGGPSVMLCAYLLFRGAVVAQSSGSAAYPCGAGPWPAYTAPAARLLPPVLSAPPYTRGFRELIALAKGVA